MIFIHHCKDWKRSRKAGGAVKILNRGAKGLKFGAQGLKFLGISGRRPSESLGPPGRDPPLSKTPNQPHLARIVPLPLAAVVDPATSEPFAKKPPRSHDRIRPPRGMAYGYLRNPSSESSVGHRSYHAASLVPVDADTWVKCSFVIA